MTALSRSTDGTGPETSRSTDGTGPEIDFAGLAAQTARLRPAIEAAIGRVLDHGRFIMGPEVAELEAALAARAGVPHCIAVSSGTDALLAALMAWQIGPGDAVFLPAFTFTATAEVIALLGARPVFVDVGPETCNIDPADLERRLDDVRREGTARPRAIIAVDLFGRPADYAALDGICQHHDLHLLADAAQSLGAVRGGVPVGGLAPVTATSFFPAKPLGAMGDAGAVFALEDGIAERIRSIRLHGKGEAKYDIRRIGLNARLDTMQAAILLAKLAVLDEELAARGRLAERYGQALGGRVDVPPPVADGRGAWAQYTVQVPDRDAVAEAMREAGVPTAVYYPRPLHLQAAYAHFGEGPGSLPVSEALCGRVLSLPMNPYLGEAAADHVSGALLAAIRGRAEPAAS